MSKPVMMWRGVPVEKLSRNELIEALVELSELLEQSSKEHIRDLKILAEGNAR